jgi:hypothetical protein
MKLLSRIADMHQNLSWKFGFRHGQEGLPFKCLWWVDRSIFSLAYIQGKGVDI